MGTGFRVGQGMVVGGQVIAAGGRHGLQLVVRQSASVMLLIPDTSLPDRTAPGARRCEPRRRTGAPADRAAPWPPAGCRRPGAAADRAPHG